MSISLLSYHINGNEKYKGLKEHRLIDTKLINKNLHIKLSSMGSLLLKGYIKEKIVGKNLWNNNYFNIDIIKNAIST